MDSKIEIAQYLDLIKKQGLPYSISDELKVITDYEQLVEYSKTHDKRLGVMYASEYNTFIVDLVENPLGERHTRERIAKTHPGNSVVIAARYNNRYVMLKQFRHAMGTYQLAFPRGYGEPNITIEENVKKEVSEELNTSASEVKIIGEVVADSGICGERVNIALCKIEKPYVDGIYEEIKDYLLLSLSEIKSLVREGKINDGFTLAALAFLST